MGSPFLKVLYASAEVSPLAKVGGLADVSGALPGALRRRGHDVRVVMPRYRSISLTSVEQLLPDKHFAVPLMGGSEEVTVSHTALKDGTSVYLLYNARYFDRPNIYMEKDDLERFTLFSIATAHLPAALEWQPDIVHCHDWHTGLVPPLWRTGCFQGDAPTASVYTIHNIGYQGGFDEWYVERVGLDEYLPVKRDPLRARASSLMGLGILHADLISTVSRTYAREILTPEYGYGLEIILQRRRSDISGIVNGIDYEEFNPSTDPRIPVRYDVNSLDKKAENKAALQARSGFPCDPKAPLIGMVGRLAAQKGLDLVAEALPPLLEETSIQFVVLGSGEEEYQEALRRICEGNPTRAHAFFTFDLSLAQLIYAGADMFLMPSRYEPCGLGQMIAMRYGTVPVVRRTGGLADTAEDCSPDLSRGNGFVFKRYDYRDLVKCVKRAVEAFRSTKSWRNIMTRAMAADFSWDVAAESYEKLYRKALRKAGSSFGSHA
jgi:starch synthase